MRRHLTDAALLFAADIGSRALNFFALVYLARVLQPAGFGRIVIALSLLEYAIWLSDWGLRTLGTRELAKPPEARHHGLGDFLAVKADDEMKNSKGKIKK